MLCSAGLCETPLTRWIVIVLEGQSQCMLDNILYIVKLLRLLTVVIFRTNRIDLNFYGKEKHENYALPSL